MELRAVQVRVIRRIAWLDQVRSEIVENFAGDCVIATNSVIRRVCIAVSVVLAAEEDRCADAYFAVVSIEDVEVVFC